MSDFLVKIHINKMEPKTRKIQTDQLGIQGLGIFPPAGSPLTILSFPLWDRKETGTELCSHPPEICSPTQDLQLPQSCPTVGTL